MDGHITLALFVAYCGAVVAVFLEMNKILGHAAPSPELRAMPDRKTTSE